MKHLIRRTLGATFFAVIATPLLAQGTTARTRPSIPGLGPKFLKVDSVSIGLSSRAIWRGYNFGLLPVEASATVALWEIDGINDKHAIIANVNGAVPLLKRDEASNHDRGDVSALYRFKFDTEDGQVLAGFTDRFLSRAAKPVDSPEISIAAQKRVCVVLCAISEAGGMIGLNVARDLRRFDATFVEPTLSIDLAQTVSPDTTGGGGTKRKQLVFRFLVAPSFSDYAKRKGGDDFGFHAFRGGVMVGFDRNLLLGRPFSMQVSAEQVISRVDRDYFQVRVSLVRKYP